jgi:hypothetical protein
MACAHSNTNNTPKIDILIANLIIPFSLIYHVLSRPRTKVIFAARATYMKTSSCTNAPDICLLFSQTPTPKPQNSLPTLENPRREEDPYI